MGISNKALKLYKYGFANQKKKLGINYWRFFFNANGQESGAERMFFVEFEMLNPYVSPDEVQLGFKPRITLKEEDLQYALAGTQAAQNIETETIVKPSYCCVRIGYFGEETKQLNYYIPLNNVVFNAKPFEIKAGSTFFSINKITGNVSVESDEVKEHPEFFGNSGEASWNISYEIEKDIIDGYSVDGMRWFPFGIQTKFAGKITFDGVDYVINPKSSFGYSERYWGKVFPEPWFHISSSDLISNITGHHLFNSSFAIKGAFDEKISFIANIEGTEIKFTADMLKKQQSSIWDCSQSPESDDPEDTKLHWSVSVNYKKWIIDVDVYCRAKELCNRVLELPEGNRNVLSILAGGSGTGEIKLYRKTRKSLEQIEHAQLKKVICEFGHREEADI